MMKAGRVLTALALAALLAPPAMAASLSAEERAMLRDAAKAQEVVGARLEKARAAAASLAPASARDARDQRKVEMAQRKLDATFAKADAALAAGDYTSAYRLAARIESLMAKGVQQ